MSGSPIPPARPKEPEGAGPSHITDHAFVPKGEWYTLCGHITKIGDSLATTEICNMSEAAHAATTLERPTRGPDPHPGRSGQV